MFNHTIDPVLIRIGLLEIRYYGLVYVIGFILGYFLLRKLVKEKHLHIKDEDILDYILAIAIGAVAGGRLFYCLVYNLKYYLPRLWEIFFIWEGGMSFHGGLIGATIAVILFSKRKNLNMLQMADMTVIPLSIALSLGRVANFINGELVGKLTSVAWCFEFPRADGCRHPSQLYAAIKNLIIFGTLWSIRKKKFKEGTLFGIFMIMYGTARIIVGFFREADLQLGWGYFLGLSLGQYLSLFMLAFGIIWLIVLYRFVHNDKITKNSKDKKDNKNNKKSKKSKTLKK